MRRHAFALSCLLGALLLFPGAMGEEDAPAAGHDEPQAPHFEDGEYDAMHMETEEELKIHKEEFDSMDTDEDGILSRDELVAASSEEEDIHPDEIDEFISELDADGDGGVSWQEYVDALFSQEFDDDIGDSEDAAAGADVGADAPQ